MLYTYRFRIYPNKEQQSFLNKQIGCCRFVYNCLLDRTIKDYEQYGKKFNYYELKKELPKLKKVYPWLKEANSQSLQESVLNLKRAFDKFFKEHTGFPKFKKKKSVNAISIPQNFKITGNCLKIPKLKTSIKIKLHRPIEGSIRRISITRTPTYKYYLNVVVEREIKPLPKSDNKIGIDVGIREYAIMFNGHNAEHIANPRHLLKTERKLKRLHRQLSRKQKGSSNRERCRRKLAKIYEKIFNQRNDFLHKLSRKIINENQVIVLEDLNVKGLVRTCPGKYMAKHLLDASWNRFQSYVKYKSDWYGRTVLNVDQFYSSSQTCNVCGYVNTALKLSDRIWTCPECHAVHDRDENAATNLYNVGQGLSEVMPVERGSVDDRGILPPKKHPLVETGSSSIH